MKSIRLALGSLLFCCLFLTFTTTAAFAELPEANSEHSTCEGSLVAVELAQLYDSWTIGIVKSGYGIVVSPPGADFTTPGKVVRFKSLLHSRELWRHEWWHYLGNTYSFIDVGFKNLERDSDALNRIIAKHLLSGSKEKLIIGFSEERVKDLRLYRGIRWALHKKVIDTYGWRKPDLKVRDLIQLFEANRDSSNSDVYALLDHDPHLRWNDLTREEVHDRMLMTLQISYYGEHQFMFPSRRGVLKSVGGKDLENRDQLPFEYRLDPKQRGAFRADFYRKFDRNKTCELARLTKVDYDLPSQMVDKFILEVIDTVVMRGMKHIVVSADGFTRRIFSRYGFKVYTKLPVEGSKDSTEVLMHLDVESSEFTKLYTRLMRNSIAVDTQEIYHE